MARVSNLITAAEMSPQWLELQHQRQLHPEIYAPKSTGLKQLDAVLQGGIELGQFALIGGEPGTGKTTLLSTVAKSFGQQKVNSVFLSAEMTTMQLGTIFFTSYSDVERSKIRSIGLEIADWARLEIAGQEISKLTLAFDYGFASVDDVDQAIDEVEAKTGMKCHAVFGDYIHLMSESGFRGNRNDEISYISKGLNRLKNNKNKVLRAIIFAAQLKKEGVKQVLADMQQFYGSAQLGWDMDIGLILATIRDEVSAERILPNARKVTVVKSRETGVGEPFEIGYDGSRGKFFDKVQIVTQAPPRNWSD